MGMVKVSLQGLADLITAGQATVTDNCSMRFVNNESVFDPSKNSNTILICFDAAHEATGWKHSVIIGTEAGYQATTPNVFNGSDEIDSACTFIGYRAGRGSYKLENAIFIGTEAGAYSSTAGGSIFIGSSAGRGTSQYNSIGIGEHALRQSVAGVGGTGNIEIVTGRLDTQRLMYGKDLDSYQLNIQNCIAGKTADSDGIAKNRISIGDATVNPDAPLSVRRESRVEMHQDTEYVQTWHNDDTLKSYVNPSGDYILYHEPNSQFVDGASHFPPDGNPTPAWFGNYEGFISHTDGGDDGILAAGSFLEPSSGKMTIWGPDFLAGGTIWVTNRDQTLAIPNGRYVVTSRVNGENRPIAMSCQDS